MDVDTAEQSYQTRDGQRFHRGDFFYTPSDDPSTWKLLRTGTPGGEPDAGHVGAAIAALGKGFRGQKVDIPAADRPGVIRKVRAAWKNLHPDAAPDEMPDVLQSMAIAMQAVTLEAEQAVHPNALPFRGILTRVDVPSDAAPGGSPGKRVLLPTSVAEDALPSLINMGIGIDSATMRKHNPRYKIGVITSAYLAQGALWVEGILYARDFPDDVARIRRMAAQGRLGMSFEIADVLIADHDADIWEIVSCCFTGAAILEKAHAAYKTTSLAAQHGDAAMEHETALAAEVQQETTTQETPVALAAADMSGLMRMMETMAGNMGRYQACMRAVDGLVGMQAGVDKMVEALEHLIEMHQALHEMDNNGGTPMGAEAQTPQTVQASESPDRLTQLETAVAQLTASMQMLTDGQTEMRSLLTDRGPGRPGAARLATDSAPARRTMAATGEYVGKYGIQAEQNYNESTIDELLRNAGVTDPTQRLAVKLEMQRAGQLVR